MARGHRRADVRTALIIFGLLALHHLPAWHEMKGNAKAHQRHEEKHP